MVGRTRVGVVLANTGSPAAPTPDEVGRYLAEFLMDPCIRPMPALPWWVILHAFILPRRAVASAGKYRAIWRPDGSPLVAVSHELARAVERRLRGRGGHLADCTVRAAMAYGEPSVPCVLAELREAGCERLVVLPMYPQSAHSTTGAVRARTDAALANMGWRPQLDFIERYGGERRYLDAVAASVRSAGFDAGRDRLVLSFHSVPQPDIEAGDTYTQQVAETCAAVASRLGIEEGGMTCAFQSPFEDARTWCGPFTVEALEGAARGCAGRLFLACPGFAVDCLETLYDVEAEFRPRAEAALPAGSHMVYVPCLNAEPAQVDLVSHLVERIVRPGARGRALGDEP